MSKQSDLVTVARDAGASGYVNAAGDTMTGTYGFGGFISLQTSDANGYPRINGSSSSAQLGLFRSSGGTEGGFYLGGDGSTFSIWSSDFVRRVNVDTAGRVTMPYQPAFSAYVTAGGVINDSLVYTTALVNTGSHYNTANGRFTAPVAGTYVFHSTTFGNTGAGTSSYFYTQFIKNGSSVGPYAHSQYNDTRSYETVTDAIILSLAANDNVGVYFIGGNSASEYGGVYSHFSGYLIG